MRQCWSGVYNLIYGSSLRLSTSGRSACAPSTSSSRRTSKTHSSRHSKKCTYLSLHYNLAHSHQLSLVHRYQTFYPEGPRKSESLGRIVGLHHAQRIKSLLDNTKGTIVFGGETDVEERYIAPTLVKDVRGDDSLMSQYVLSRQPRPLHAHVIHLCREVFGPILSLVPVKDIDEAIKFINAR